VQDETSLGEFTCPEIISCSWTDRKNGDSDVQRKAKEAERENSEKEKEPIAWEPMNCYVPP